MKVAFLVNDLQLSGGVGVVVEHARQLARHGIEASLVLARERMDPDWRFRGLDEVGVLSLGEARTQRFEVAVATWWETTEALFEIDAARRAYFVQSLEDRFYRPDEPQRLGAALTHDLPVHVITEARWSKLPESVKKAMQEAAKMATQTLCTGMMQEEVASLEKLKQAGVTIVRWSAEDKKEMEGVMASVAEEWAAQMDKRGKPGTEMVKAVQNARTGR